MQTKLYSNAWHLLTGEQIIQMFDSLPQVSIQPNNQIVRQLKALEVATLELIEDRSFNTIYRIQENGIVYEVNSHTGFAQVFDDLESYDHCDKLGELVKRYLPKEPVHKLEEINGKQILTRLKYPRFTAEYQPKGLSNLINIQWIDTPPQSVSTVANLMRKAGAFIAHKINRNS